MNPLINILGSPNSFLESLFHQLNVTTIDVANLEMDHICYRVETEKDYQSLKLQLLKYGKLLSDQIIGGRPISIIELNDPYIYNGRKIDILELPSPKEGRSYSRGYEHVEFVVDVDLKYFIAKYKDQSFDLKGMDKTINRDARIQLNNCSVKFHEHSLKYVIEVLEK